MKKILIASTALVATAGVAAAEVTVGGTARFGLAYNEGAAEETRVEQRMRINLTGIAETDAGVKFEARFRLESNEDANSSIAGRGPGAAGFAVTSGPLRLDVGNVSDVIDSGDVGSYYGYGVGLTAFLEQSSAFYTTDIPVGGFGAGDQDATTVKLRYSGGTFNAAVSYSDNKVADEQEVQVGLGVDLGDYGFGVAFGDEDGVAGAGQFWVVTAEGSFGAFGVRAVVGDGDNFDDVAYGLSAQYEVGAATAIQFAAADGGNATDTAVGIGFTHSLGGGVTLAGGVGQSTAGNTQADLGVKFSF